MNVIVFLPYQQRRVSDAEARAKDARHIEMFKDV